MHERRTTVDRLIAFSDGVIAVLITIMVLELKVPDDATFPALLPLWPTAVSYAVSYLFIAIIWLNHHHLLRSVARVTPGLIWVNFAHLFGISLVPFTTAWVARTELSPASVMLYAAVFVCVNIAYLVFVRQVLRQANPTEIPTRAKLMQRRRSVATLAIFASAMPVSLVAPRIGFGLICCALIPYLRPEASGVGLRRSPRARMLHPTRPIR